MEDQNFLELATRYVSGAASAEEIELLQSLLKEEYYAELFRKVNSTWLEAGKSAREPHFDTERGLNHLAERLRKHEPFVRWGPNRRRFPNSKYSAFYFGVAAATVTVILLACIQIYELEFRKHPAEAAWIEKRTGMGEKLVVSLPDGSTITLNADSQLKYPALFDGHAREVTLQGEAYFEVTHDSLKSFIVRTGKVSTTDLGTRFNVSAYPSDTTITVSLDEGKVEVAANEARVNGIVLAPAQQIVYHRTSCATQVGPFNSRAASGWKDNFFLFDNVPLSTVFEKMERHFGVKFELADTAVTQRIIKAEFHNESVWTVAEILKTTAGLTCTLITDQNSLKKIVFSKN
jgi:transmembrane sensor